MKIFKILSFIILIFLFSMGLIVLSFVCYWFDPNNLGPYMREHRMKKNFYSIKYNNQTYDFIYKRNYYGFRGDEINLEDIKAIFIGGSTADERYNPKNIQLLDILIKN